MQFVSSSTPLDPVNVVFSHLSATCGLSRLLPVYLGLKILLRFSIVILPVLFSCFIGEFDVIGPSQVDKWELTTGNMFHRADIANSLLNFT
jgi:hypothetical protein